MKRRAAITRAQIERAIKAAKATGMTRVEIEAGGVKLVYIVENGDKQTIKVAKLPRTLI